MRAYSVASFNIYSFSLIDRSVGGEAADGGDDDVEDDDDAAWLGGTPPAWPAALLSGSCVEVDALALPRSFFFPFVLAREDAVSCVLVLDFGLGLALRPVVAPAGDPGGGPPRLPAGLLRYYSI